jgi:hypothetical protein
LASCGFTAPKAVFPLEIATCLLRCSLWGPFEFTVKFMPIVTDGCQAIVTVYEGRTLVDGYGCCCGGVLCHSVQREVA